MASSSMAEVSYLHLHEDDDDDAAADDNRDASAGTLDSALYWSHDFDVFPADSEFPPSDISPSLGPRIPAVRRRNPDRNRGADDAASDPESITTIGPVDRESQVNFVMDLFHQRVEQSSVRGFVDFGSSDLNLDLDPNFGVIEENDEMCSCDLELDLGLGLGFCVDRHCLAAAAPDDDDDDHDCGFMVDDCCDECFVSRRGSVSESGGGSSAVCGGGAQFIAGGLSVGIVSDSEEDENEVLGIDLNAEGDCELDSNGCDDDTSLRLCWDSFQLEDHRDADEDFEWEEVDDGVDEREVLSMVFDAEVDEDLDVSVSTVIPSPGEMGVETADTMGNLEWQVLLNVHNFEMNVDLEHDGEPYLGDPFEHNYTYEMLFGQFAENENALVGKPPASKTLVENLQTVVLTQEDLDVNNALCAVCKDEINVGGQAKQLPCSHRYHGDCIVPWLSIRNTCPVCRYELPTDDPDYERRRTQRPGHVR